MAIGQGVYATPLLLTLTAGANAQNWTTVGVNGVQVGLATAGPDTTTNLEAAAGANCSYVGGLTEATGGHGYTTGGLNIAGPVWSVLAATGLKYTSTAPVWTATDSTGIASVTYCFFYVNFAAGNKYMLFALSLGGTFSATGNNATFTITPAANGYLTFTLHA